MADIDVSFILLDPDFADSIDIMRITQTVSKDTGLASQEQIVYSDVVAVVQQNTGHALVRLADGTQIRGDISVHCTTELRTADGDDVADIVWWRGQPYTVIAVSDWSNYGTGFYMAACIAKQVSTIVPIPTPGVC